MRTLILGIRNARFTLYVDGKRRYWCAQNAPALARMFKRAGYDPLAEPRQDVMMFSSSMNWPQDSGAPKHFHIGRVDAVVQEAIVLFLPKEEQAKVRAKLKEQARASKNQRRAS